MARTAAREKLCGPKIQRFSSWGHITSPKMDVFGLEVFLIASFRQKKLFFWLKIYSQAYQQWFSSQIWLENDAKHKNKL